MGIIQDFLGYVKAGVLDPEVVQDTVARAFRGLRDGTLSVADFKLICALEGVLFQADIGTLVTTIAGHAVIAQLQPEANIDVPAGTTAIVLPPNVYLETSAGTLTRIVAASLNQLMGRGTSSAATAGPTSVRSDRKRPSACDVRQVYSGNGNAITAPVSQIEHWRSGYPFADATGAPVKRFQPLLEEWQFPVLIGPASFQLYFGSTTTAPNGWAQLSWIELPSNRLA